MTKSLPLIVALFFLAIFTVSSVLALTATIDNPKMVLFKNISSGQTLKFQNSVTVDNENNHSILIIIEPDSKWKPYLTLKKNNFTLEPDTREEVFYTVKLNQSGEYAGDIVVNFVYELYHSFG